MIKTHTLILENTHGEQVARVTKVVSNDVRTVFNKLAARAAGMAAPCIYLDGYGFTSRGEFEKMVRIVNEVSTKSGGRQVY